MAFVNIFSNEKFFAVLWPPLRTVFGSEISISSTFNVLPALEFKHCLVFLFLKKNVDSFSVSVSLSLMYLCIYCIYSKNTQNGSKNLKIYCPVKISQLYYEKPCRSFPKCLQESWNRKWLQHLVADALFRWSKTDYLSVESNQRFRSLSMGTSPCVKG